MTKVLSKTEKAINIVKKFDDGRPTGEIVDKIAAACKLNKPAARTYFYNARKAIENAETDVTVKKARAARKQKPKVTAELQVAAQQAGFTDAVAVQVAEDAVGA